MPARNERSDPSAATLSTCRSIQALCNSEVVGVDAESLRHDLRTVLAVDELPRVVVSPQNDDRLKVVGGRSGPVRLGRLRVPRMSSRS